MSIFDHQTGLTSSVSDRLSLAVRQIEFARRYTLSLLEGLDDGEWFWTPAGESGYGSHVAWQCGHLAMAQYGLTLFRQRGRAEIDSSLMSARFRKRFMRGTEAVADPTLYASPEEIRNVMDAVHRQMLIEIPDFDGPALDEPLDEPHAAVSSRLGSLLFAAQHEMVHAGQIGMLRRLMGKPALR